MQTLVASLVAGVAVGCVGFTSGTESRSLVPPGPLGEIVADPAATGPPIECRGITRDRCLRAGSMEGTVGGIDVSEAVRVIVSCEGAPCTTVGGAMRIDFLLRDGATVEVARGGYGEFTQP